MAVISTLALIGCADDQSVATDPLKPDYLGVETRLLDGDLVQFNVAMFNALGVGEVTEYAKCAAAGYTIVRGYGFARHVRTQVDLDGQIWRGDSVYLISAGLPRGINTIDAEVVAASCRENGIPLV